MTMMTLVIDIYIINRNLLTKNTNINGLEKHLMFKNNKSLAVFDETFKY